MLYPTQQEILDQSQPNQLYALGTSSGKTLISIAHYHKYNEDKEPLLVVAPASKIKTNDWPSEIERYCNAVGIEIDYDIISYNKIAKHWQEYKGYFVIFDECHMLKNPTSKRGKACFKLTQYATHYCLLSATPASNGWADCMNYFIMWGFFKNKTHFEREHAIFKRMQFGSNSFQKIVDYKDTDKLMELYNAIAIQKPTEYFVDLPEVSERFVNISKPSQLYKVAKKDKVIDFKGQEVILDTQAKLSGALRYLTNQQEKLNYTKDLFESTNENILIFTEFKRERDDLLDLAYECNKEIFEVTGSNNDLPSRMEWQDLKNAVTIVNYKAGAAGIELSYNDIVIFYTPTYSYQDYIQAKGRAVRHRARPRITILNYKTKGTIESKVWQCLDEKKDFTNDLLEGFA